MAKLDEHYANPKLVEIYDVENGWSVDRDFYLNLAGDRPTRVLDLGCGTGLLCDAYAVRNHAVCGVDPAASMLDVARRRPNGQKVSWILSDSQSFASDDRYDFIIMTGHAFQVLLKEDDIRGTFRVMQKHLDLEGIIAFESRNPEIDWASRWNKTTDIVLPSGPISIERTVNSFLGHKISFDTRYHFTDETLVSKSELRFWNFDQINELLRECGLRLVEFYGAWDRSQFDSSSSEEMIFVAKNASE